MTDVHLEFEQNPEAMQQALLQQAADVLGVHIDELSGWKINRIREDGAIDAYVPIDKIDVDGVPTDPDNVEHLVTLFDERAEEVGGSGQRDPVVVGHIPGDAFYMLDGFHRHAVQTARKVDYLHATVEPNLSYELVVKRRLEYARTHPEVEFARQVEWMQRVWERTPWAAEVPNVLTAFRAFKNDAFEVTDDLEIIDGLSDTVYNDIRNWVVHISKEWGYTPDEIRENLAKVESFDKSLMHLVYQKAGKTPAGRIGLGHVEAISKTYPGEFDMQQAVVELIIGHELTVAQTAELIKQIEATRPMDAEDVIDASASIDFIKLKKVKAKKVSTPSSKNQRALDLDPNQSVVALLRSIDGVLPAIDLSETSSPEEAKEARELAMRIAMVLSEKIAILVTRS